MTLNVLERLLLQFQGSVLLVTHDRYFLDKVATAILAFEGQGRVVRYPGNFETYRSLRGQSAKPALAAARSAAGQAAPGREVVRKVGKLSFKEQRELEGMEPAIERAEQRLAAAQVALSDPRTYSGDPKQVPLLKKTLESAQREVEALYARWQVLQDLGR